MKKFSHHQILLIYYKMNNSSKILNKKVEKMGNVQEMGLIQLGDRVP